MLQKRSKLISVMSSKLYGQPRRRHARIVPRFQALDQAALLDQGRDERLLDHVAGLLVDANGAPGSILGRHLTTISGGLKGIPPSI